MCQGKVTAINEDISALQTRITIESHRFESDGRARNPWHLSSCRLTETQKLHFRALYNDSNRFSRTKIDHLREAASAAPPVPDMSFRLRVSACPIDVVPKLLANDWVAEVCLRREVLSGTIFQIDRDNMETEYFLLTWAYQSPYMLGLVLLRRRPWPPHHSDPIALLESHWEYEFDIVPKFMFSDEGQMQWEQQSIHILSPVVVLKGGRVVSCSRPIARVAKRGQQEHPEPRRPIAPRVEAQARFLHEHPWAMEFLEDGRQILKREKARRGEKDAQQNEEKEEEEH